MKRAATALILAACLISAANATTCPTCEQWIADRDWCYEAHSFAEQKLVYALGDRARAERDRDDYEFDLYHAEMFLATLQQAQSGYRATWVQLMQVPESQRDAEWDQEMSQVMTSLGNLSGLIVQTENEIESCGLHLVAACAAIEAALLDIEHWEATIVLCDAAIDSLTNQIDSCTH